MVARNDDDRRRQFLDEGAGSGKLPPAAALRQVAGDDGQIGPVLCEAGKQKLGGLPATAIGQICTGEVYGRARPGFDFRQLPFEISGVDFGGKTIIQRTSAGTQGIVAAGNRAVRLYAASLVTAKATVRALLLGSPGQISLVAMGDTNR
jgi:2-phosphosulfolactate phosphatase